MTSSRITEAYEARARVVLKVLAVTIVVGAALAALIGHVAESYESNKCTPAAWWPSDPIRNSTVYANTRPTCDDGVWTVTTPRDDMPEDAYGWNCFKDGNGVCGPLEVLDPTCMTDPTDGYTMCPNGDVYYRDTSGVKLWPVERNPK